jgi:transposase
VAGTQATKTHAPQASILFDKFHVLRHLGEALDTVRKSEYARLSGKGRRFIKGQKYTLLSSRENVTLEGRRSLKLLLAANKNWRDSLKWQRLQPYVKFAKMIERHWAGIAAHCAVENKVALGFVEGLSCLRSEPSSLVWFLVGFLPTRKPEEPLL